MTTVHDALLSMQLSNNETKIADAAAIQAMKLIETRRVATAACDGIAILYNPDWIATLTIEQTQGLLVHELCHAIFRHNDRYTQSGYSNHSRANRAMDREINPIVRDSGYQLPPDGCWPKQINQPEHRSWEEYYHHDTDEHGDETADSSDLAELDTEPGDVDPIESGVHATGELARQLLADLSDAEPADLREIADEIASEAAMLVAGSSSKLGKLVKARVIGKAGTGSGAEQLTAEMVTTSGVSWQEVVIDLVANQIGRETAADWSRPSRRSHSAGVFLPGRVRTESRLKLALILDVSGSCVAYFNHWQALARQMVDDLPQIAELEIIYHDDRVTKRDSWSRRDGDEVMIATRGGGGTDFRDAIRAAELAEVDGAILFTDADGPWPASTTLNCVTVLLPGSRHRAPFGRNVLIESL